jgi:uncharacterized protein YjhX (UPF0386 family)
MIVEGFNNKRELKTVKFETELLVVGGGLTGVCCAITAARAGVKVILIQDRPILGGNASSEVRLWSLGATSHMGNNNRWSREGGVINEILTENTYRNKEGNPVIFDMLLIDKVLNENNIILLLNTCVFSIEKYSTKKIKSVKAYNSSSETFYEVEAQFFADCSGDGIISYLAGIPYRIGAEDGNEFFEGFAPDKEVYGEVMGHSIFFYMKDTGSPVSFVKPDFALENIEEYVSKINNNEYFSINHHGCKYWWLEYGGRLDTIHDTEKIKFELWKVVYGIWNYIKNSGKYPEMQNYTLEWVGLIPGKRESRRFKGLYMLSQKDIMEQRLHYDAVAYGGWAIDLHPSDGVYASGKACNQWHSKGVYQIPYRCYLSDAVSNLMFGGRIISASHVANGSTRVMCTSALGGQVIGMTISLCLKKNLLPIDFVDETRIKDLQRELILCGNFIPNIDLDDNDNILKDAVIECSSTYKLSELKSNGSFESLRYSAALLFPIKDTLPGMSIEVEAIEDTELEIQLRKSSKRGNYTPDETLEVKKIYIKQGRQFVHFVFDRHFEKEEYVFIAFMSNDKVSLAVSDNILTGVTTVYNQVNIAVSNYGRQDPPEGIGIEAFEFWCPKRRPEAKNLAIIFDTPLSLYAVDNLKNLCYRPFNGTNAWAADSNDSTPYLAVNWNVEKKISKMIFNFDVDYDHAMETVQYGHYDDVMPQCVRDFTIIDDKGNVVKEVKNNYLSQVVIRLDSSLKTDSLRIYFHKPNENTPVCVMGIGIY